MDNSTPLLHYWYPAALSRDLVQKQLPQRSVVLSMPILLRRLATGKVIAFYDACPHRGAPLSAGKSVGNQITCPYHGWTFDAEGQCTDIPGLPEGAKRDSTLNRVCLRSVAVQEINGIVWVHLSKQPAEALPIDASGHKRLFFKETFAVGLEDLIENFVDPMHTVYVHEGIIRQKKKPSLRKLKFSADHTTLTIEHPQQFEEVGPLGRLINPRRTAFSHKETVTFPNLLHINYTFSAERFFTAEIALCPISEHATIAYIALSFNFGIWTQPARLLVPYFARKVIKQDKEILALLGSNAVLRNHNNDAVAYTAIPNEPHFKELRKRLARIRNGIEQGSALEGEFELNI